GDGVPGAAAGPAARRDRSGHRHLGGGRPPVPRRRPLAPHRPARGRCLHPQGAGVGDRRARCVRCEGRAVDLPALPGRPRPGVHEPARVGSGPGRPPQRAAPPGRGRPPGGGDGGRPPGLVRPAAAGPGSGASTRRVALHRRVRPDDRRVARPATRRPRPHPDIGVLTDTPCRSARTRNPDGAQFTRGALLGTTGASRPVPAVAVAEAGAVSTPEPSSWYSSSTLTDQMSWSPRPRMFSTVNMAVSIEWSWLLYLCMPLRPTGCTLGTLASSQRRSTATLAL